MSLASQEDLRFQWYKYGRAIPFLHFQFPLPLLNNNLPSSIMKYLSQLALLPLALAAPLLQPRQEASVIPNKWIAVLRDNADDSILTSTVQAVTEALGGNAPDRIYNMPGFKGFSLTAENAVLNLVTNLADIKYVEQDVQVFASALTSQANPPYGLARISHRDRGADEYVYDDSAGEGTESYIIDTGTL